MTKTVSHDVNCKRVRIALKKLEKGDFDIGPLKKFGPFKEAMKTVLSKAKSKSGDPENLKRYIAERRSPNNDVFRKVFKSKKGDVSKPQKMKDWKTAGEQRKQLKEIEWLWDKWIVKGTLTFLFGEAGKGKSALLMRLIASITKGEPWPNAVKGPSDPRPVIWCETEANQALNDKRLVDFGIPDDLVLYPNTEAEDFQLESASDMATLKRMIREVEPALVVVDSLTGGISNEGPKTLREITLRLRDLARETNTSIIAVHHARKVRSSRDRMELNDMRGTSALGQQAKSAIGLDEPDPKGDKGHLRVSHVKCNYGIKQPSLGMKWKSKGIVFNTEAPQPAEEESVHVMVGGLLNTLLAKGPKRATFIERKCEEAEINYRTAKKYKKDWGISSKKVGKRSYWMLPGQTLPKR